MIESKLIKLKLRKLAANSLGDVQRLEHHLFNRPMIENVVEIEGKMSPGRMDENQEPKAPCSKRRRH